MTRDDLREQIAQEAARLLLRGKEQDFAAARKRAARWLKRKRLRRDEIPSNQEIQVQLYALSGLMASERDPMVLAQQREWTARLCDVLAGLPVWCGGAITASSTAPGAEILLRVAAPLDAVMTACTTAGYDPHPERGAEDAGPRWRIRLRGQFPCLIEAVLPGEEVELDQADEWLSSDDLRAQTAGADLPELRTADDEHPDSFAVFQMLLEPLERVRLPPDSHPEGDALYHSLQVFELGKEQRPYDEEFLLACLLHDVGLAINPRHPVLSAIDALGQLITERTRFLIENRPVASHYLRTGECPKSLRRSEDFEDAVLLAKCDREGRVAGASVCTLDEAFDYLAGLDEYWDDV